MSLPKIDSQSSSNIYQPVDMRPAIFDKTTSLRTSEGNNLVSHDGNLSNEGNRLFPTNQSSIKKRNVRHDNNDRLSCNPDRLFPKLMSITQPFIGILSFLTCKFKLFARIARNQLGLTPGQPGKLVFEPLPLAISATSATSTPKTANNTTKSVPEFISEANLESTTTSDYFLDKSSTAWAGITNADSRNVLNECRQNPAQAKFVNSYYESFEEDLDENSSKVAIPCKPECHLQGRSSSHGIRGEAAVQTKTQKCLEPIASGKTSYYYGSPTCQEPLGFDTRGEKTPNPYDSGRGCGGSTMSGAAIVASGAAPVVTATDAGGSARGPAHHVGVVGFKGGRDIEGNSFLSRTDSAYETSSLCDSGLIANNLSNLVDVVQHMTDVVPTQDCLNYKAAKIAVDTGSLNRVVAPGVADKVQKAVTIWKEDNTEHTFHEVDVMSLETDQGESNALTAMLAHAAHFATEEIEVFDNALSPEQKKNAPPSLKANIATARVITKDQQERSELVKLQIEKRLESMYACGIKFLILPTGNKVAQPVNWLHRNFDSSNPKHTFQYTQLESYANMAGVAAISLPVGYTEDDDHMPTSMTIMATSKEVNTWELFAVGREFEQLSRNHDDLKLDKPEFYIHEQLTNARDKRKAAVLSDSDC